MEKVIKTAYEDEILLVENFIDISGIFAAIASVNLAKKEVYVRYITLFVEDDKVPDDVASVLLGKVEEWATKEGYELKKM